MTEENNFIPAPVLTLFPPGPATHRTVCVVGARTGGAPLVLAILRRLGVSLLAADDDGFGETSAAGHHQARAIWGWDRVLEPDDIKALMPRMRNPVFLFVTRDPAAIAHLARHADHVTRRDRLLSYVRDAASLHDRLATLLNEAARPTLLISHEGGARDPTLLGRAIARKSAIDFPDDLAAWLEGTPAVPGSAQILLHEGRRGGGQGIAPDAAGGLALYVRAADSLGQGNTAEMLALAAIIVDMNVPRIAHLADGPLGVIAEAECGNGPETVYPDLVGAAFYLIGFARLLNSQPQQARLNLLVAERIMRRRLVLGLPDSPLSADNYWSCVFHMALAAKAIQRDDLCGDGRALIMEASASPQPARLAALGTALLDVFHARALSEL
jgi:hypothetical protein